MALTACLLLSDTSFDTGSGDASFDAGSGDASFDTGSGDASFDTGSDCMLSTQHFVPVNSGTFTMGSPDSEYGFEDQHQVTISRDFYLQEHEVTQCEWQALVGNNPSYFGSCGDDCPVEQVNWYEAVEFANRLSRAGGYQECYSLSGCSGSIGEGMLCESVTFVGLDCTGYRLPTEAEWEYAARAGTTTAWYCGPTESCVDNIAWYSRNSGGTTHPVGGKQANAWGLYDMLGNVWEWVWDIAAEYPTGSVTDPLGASSGDARVSRGGGWNGSERLARAAHRFAGAPGIRESSTGFRLARSAP